MAPRWDFLLRGTGICMSGEVGFTPMQIIWALWRRGVKTVLSGRDPRRLKHAANMLWQQRNIIIECRLHILNVDPADRLAAAERQAETTG